MSATVFLHIHIHHSHIQPACKSLRAGNHGRRMMQEAHHMGRIAVTRLLVTHKSAYTLESVALLPDKVAQNLALGI